MRFNKLQRLALEEMLGSPATFRLLDALGISNERRLGIGAELPAALSDKQRQALEQFFDTLPKSPEHPDRVKLGGLWIDKTKQGFVGSVQRILCDFHSIKQTPA
jgi:hypothetical protein